MKKQSYNAVGIIEAIFPTKQITEKFQAREIILRQEEITEHGTFLELLKFQAVQGNCGMFDFVPVGTRVNLKFNLKGRKSQKDGEDIYFTSLEIYQVSLALPESAVSDVNPEIAQEHAAEEKADFEARKLENKKKNDEKSKKNQPAKDDLPF